MWSGFAKAGTAPDGRGEMNVNYVFIEAEHDPKSKPVVVWYNGGPGAASMFGLFVELGPYLLNADSLDASNPAFNATGVPQVQYNPVAWTQAANIIAVNNPPPIGFSYCDAGGVGGDGYSCGDWDDGLVAEANRVFLTNLFSTEFPEYAKNELYLTGESYAGVYVPTIARAIYKQPGPLNLKGFAVGDGCMGKDVLCGDGNPDKGPFYQVEFLHGHGQVSERNYRAIRKACPEAALRSGGPSLSAACNATLKQMQDNLGGFFGYSLYDDCIYQEAFGTAMREAAAGGSGSASNSASSSSSSSSSSSAAARGVGGALNDYPCPGQAMSQWLKRDDVKKALNIPDGARFNSADNGVGMNYTLSEPDLLPFYQHAMTKTDLRVLVYNGDTDPGINSMVTQDKYFTFFSSVGIEPDRQWRPWTLDGKQRMGGYAVEYPGDFTYATIRGAGHMPAAALAMLRSFLQGTKLPEYHASGPTSSLGGSRYEL
eukprot:g4438.t1